MHLTSEIARSAAFSPSVNMARFLQQLAGAPRRYQLLFPLFHCYPSVHGRIYRPYPGGGYLPGKQTVNTGGACQPPWRRTDSGGSPMTKVIPKAPRKVKQDLPLRSLEVAR
jgi:hypothetical protein